MPRPWPYFGWVNAETVMQTIEQTTELGVAVESFPMKMYLKSRNLSFNIPRRYEHVATDTVFSDTPAIDSGVKQAQILVGRC